MSEGVDYSFDRPNVVSLWNAGKTFAGRYFGLGTQDKLATATEIAALHSMGIATFALAEQWGDSSLQGFNLGAHHASVVKDDMDAKGVPPDRPVYFAVDFDVQAYQWPAVVQYFHGVNYFLPLERIGIYGGVHAMQWAQRDGLALWFFQTYGWSYGNWFGGNHVEQYSNRHPLGGGEVDYCRSITDDFGQWPGGYGGPTPGQPNTIPVVTAGAWDYTGEIAGTAGDTGQLAAYYDEHARNLDGLRNF